MIASRQASTLVLLFVVLISLLVVSSFTTMVHATATPSLDPTTIDLYKVMTPKRKEKIKRNLSENMANREAAFEDWLDGLNKDLEYDRDGYIIGIIVLSVFSGVFLLLAIIFCCLGATTQYSRQQTTFSAALLKSQAEMPQSRPAAPITLQPMLGSESAGNGSARACNPNGSTPKDPELIRPASFAGPPRAILSKSPFPAALPLHMRPHVPRGSPGPVSPNRVVLSGPPHLPHTPSTSPLRVGALPAVGSKAGSPKMSPGVVNLSPTRILSPDQVSVNGKDPMSKASPVAGSPRLPVNLSPTRQGVTGEPKSSGIPKPLSASPPKLPPNLSPKETKEII